MASIAHRVKSGAPLLSKAIRSESFLQRSALCPTFTDSELSRNYATAAAAGPKEKKVKVPLALFGGAGNYATAFYVAAVKANVLDKVEPEFLDLVEATKKSPSFSQFIMDLSVPADTRVKAMTDICSQAKFSEITENFLPSIKVSTMRFVLPSKFRLSRLLVRMSVAQRSFINSYHDELLTMKHGCNKIINEPTSDSRRVRTRMSVALSVVLAENGRLRNVDSIAKKFVELTMAHKGIVKATVTSVILLPADEEKELKDTLQEIIGQGKKVILEQKIDPSILGGIVVEFSQKVFDMSIRTRARQMERFLRDPVNLEGGI